MTDEQWENLIYKIEEKFGIINREEEDIVVDELSTGEKIKGKLERIEFSGPLGKMKLEREIRPRVEDKKTLYSRRIGGKTTEDYVYSKEETVSKVKAYKWNERSNEWVEIEVPF